MTTKKKSLLGIGCLSVAMLSISLLMVKPVSAEEYTLDSSYQTGFTEGQKVGYHDGLYPYSDSQYQSPSETHSDDNEYIKGYKDGFQVGYRDGKKQYTNQSIVVKIWYWVASYFY